MGIPAPAAMPPAGSTADRPRAAPRERLRARFPHDRFVGLERARWGFATPTRILTLASGRRIVLQLVPDSVGRRAPEGWRAFHDAGLPVATLVARLARPRATCLAWEFVEGTTGASLMDGPRATVVASQMGRLSREIQAVLDPAVRADEAWRSPEALRRAAHGWLASVVTPESKPSFGGIVDRVAARRWTPSVTHGDFVPANVLVVDRRITAVIDLGDVALRHPLVDAAWWSLIVAFHHGSDHARLEAMFLEGAGLAATEDERQQLADVAALRVLQIAAATSRARSEHVRLLAAAIRRADRRRRATSPRRTPSSRCQ